MWINCALRTGCRSVYWCNIMSARIYDTDTAQEIAMKIWSTFQVGDFCVVTGWVQMGETLLPKGQNVLEWIKWHYENKHYGHQGRARTFEYEKGNAIGGPIAHPIFKWDKVNVGGEPKYQIWRSQ